MTSRGTSVVGADKRGEGDHKIRYCLRQHAGHETLLCTSVIRFHHRIEHTYAGTLARLLRQKKMSALLEYLAATAGLESNRRVRRSCEQSKITPQPNSLSRLE